MRPWLLPFVCVLFASSPIGLLADEPPEKGPPAEAPGASTPVAPSPEAIAEGMKSQDPAVRLRSFQAAADLQDEALLPLLLKGVKDDDASVRLAAIAALARRTGPEARKKAAAAVGPRIKPLLGNPAAHEELRAAIEALHDLAQPSSIRPLLDDLTVHTDRDVVRRCLRAVGNVPSLEAIEALIDFGSKGRNEGSGGQREAARSALTYATGGIRFGNLDEWHIWWSKNRRTFDVEAAAKTRAEARAREEAKEAEEKARKEKREERRRGRKKEGGGGEGEEKTLPEN